MTSRTLTLLGLLGVCALGINPKALAQHSHINAGAKSSTAGSPLFFANGRAFEAASGYLIHLIPTQSTNYGALHFGGTDVTFTSLAAFPDNGGPNTFAALPGTHVEMILETLRGPTGGALSIWDSVDGFFDATEITFTVPVGTVAGTERMALSENDGSAGADPYGHIHGRRFSANLPGLYVAGFRLVDTSKNGPRAGPIHAPSDLAYFNFQAGVSIADVSLAADHMRVRFGTDVGRSYSVEVSDSVGPTAVWRMVSVPSPGTGRLESADIPLAPPIAAQVFFRLKAE